DAVVIAHVREVVDGAGFVAGFGVNAAGVAVEADGVGAGDRGVGRGGGIDVRAAVGHTRRARRGGGGRLAGRAVDQHQMVLSDEWLVALKVRRGVHFDRAAPD